MVRGRRASSEESFSDISLFASKSFSASEKCASFEACAAASSFAFQVSSFEDSVRLNSAINRNRTQRIRIVDTFLMRALLNLNRKHAPFARTSFAVVERDFLFAP